MSRAISNVISVLLSSNSLYRTFVETVTTLYPRSFVFCRSSIIVMLLCSALLVSIYSLSLDLRYIFVWSCVFHITGHPKYNTTNPDQECAISESSLDSSGNPLIIKSSSDYTLMLLSRRQIYMTIFQFPSIDSPSFRQPHQVVFLDPRKIALNDVPLMPCMV